MAFEADWSLSDVGEDERARLLCRSQFTEQAAGSDATLHMLSSKSSLLPADADEQNRI
ncbi:hypothetical protein [Pectobacterium araliae]|uniref:hypothetical protein n=1 Tax=Pectobacterium araliae TaxID=3073862 RepID=UPI0021C26657